MTVLVPAFYDRHLFKAQGAGSKKEGLSRHESYLECCTAEIKLGQGMSRRIFIATYSVPAKGM
jgi:hypothetical protein